METFFLLIYELYISGKKHSCKINMTQNYTLTYAINWNEVNGFIHVIKERHR